MAQPPLASVCSFSKSTWFLLAAGVSPTAAGVKARLGLCPMDGGQSALGAQLGAALEVAMEIELASSDTEGESSGFPELSEVSISQDAANIYVMCVSSSEKREVKTHTPRELL